MTPLARSLFLGTGELVDEIEDLRDDLLECQFFEVTDLYHVVSEMAWDVAYGKTVLSTEGLFLPAEPCVIEYFDGAQRDAWILSRHGDRISAVGFWGHVKGWISGSGKTDIFKELKPGPLVNVMELFAIPPDEPDGGPSTERFELWERAMIAIFISMINTPRIIGRRQHMPTAKLERELLRSRKPIGKFPLGSWSEILLRVTPPQDASGEASREAHLTGRKAMHFCRAHLRVRLGKVEVVRGHWRGDPSLGTKRSRYVLTH